MKKVLFLTNTFPIDDNLSSGVFNFNAAIQLDEVSDLTVVHLRSWGPFRKVIENKKIQNINLLCFSFPFYPVKNNFLTGAQLFLYQYFLRKLLSGLLKEQEVIHSVGASFSGVIGAYLSKALQIPHVAQCIGTDVNITLPSKKDSYFYSVMKKYVNIYTTNSFALEKQVRSMYSSASVKTIYRGVNLNFFGLDESIAPNNKVTFAFIGGLSYREEHHAGRDYKGGITLLKAWQALTNHDNVELHFAGPEVTKESVEDILEQNLAELNIQVCSYLNREDVRDLFALADVVVVASWMEGLPNAGMEALASSCVLVGTNVGGIPELINDNGILFQPGDIKSLTKILQNLISNPNRISLLKKNSLNLAVNKFQSEQFPKLYRELYEKL